jgi:fibronectin type III domain protein
MMLKFSRRTLACVAAAGALAAGCTLTGIGVGAANAATAKPGKVSGLAVENGSVTTDGATLTWDKDAGAASYRVVIGNASTPTAGASYDRSGLTGTSVTVSTLRAGTAYEAKISADNSAGASEWSAWVLFYTNAAQGAQGAQGTQGPQGAQGPSGVVSTRRYTLTPESSVTTGGHFTANAKLVGTVPLAAGTYLLNVNFMATPNAATSGAVFPQAFVYNGPVNPGFTNDLFNVGSGALEQATQAEVTAGDTINSYYSGTDEITVPSGGETLDVYAFGYDSDTGPGSYQLNSATVTATALNVAS